MGDQHQIHMRRQRGLPRIEKKMYDFGPANILYVMSFSSVIKLRNVLSISRTSMLAV